MAKIEYYLAELRISEWYKNLLVFLALFFSRRLFLFQYYTPLFLGFLVLSLSSSSGYIVNDIKDASIDVFHPKKRTRPVASRKIGKTSALLFSILILTVSLLASYLINTALLILSIILFLNTLIYSLLLRNTAWLDVLSVSLNYVIRSLAGCVIINVYISPWLVIGVFYVAMLFALAKRRVELATLEKPEYHRKSFKSYNLNVIDQVISIFSALIIISYALYTLYSPYSNPMLLLTIPVVILIVLRFTSISKKEGTNIVRKTLTDKIMIVVLIIWFLATFYSIYLSNLLF